MSASLNTRQSQKAMKEKILAGETYCIARVAHPVYRWGMSGLYNERIVPGKYHTRTAAQLVGWKYQPIKSLPFCYMITPAMEGQWWVIMLDHLIYCCLVYKLIVFCVLMFHNPKTSLLHAVFTKKSFKFQCNFWNHRKICKKTQFSIKGTQQVYWKIFAIKKVLQIESSNLAGEMQFRWSFFSLHQDIVINVMSWHTHVMSCHAKIK